MSLFSYLSLSRMIYNAIYFYMTMGPEYQFCLYGLQLLLKVLELGYVRPSKSKTIVLTTIDSSSRASLLSKNASSEPLPLNTEEEEFVLVTKSES